MTLPTLKDPIGRAAATLAEALPEGHGLSPDEVRALAESIVSSALDDDVADAFADAIETSLDLAETSYRELPEQFANPFESRVRSQIVVRAVRSVLAPARRTTATFDEVAGVVARMAYGDAVFTVSQLGDGTPTIEVVMTRENTFGGRDVRISRQVPLIDGDAAKTAYAALLKIEEHEVGERFTIDGKRVFDPHKWPPSERFAPPLELDSSGP